MEREDLPKLIACFDDLGACRMIMSGSEAQPPDGYAYIAEVPAGTEVSDVYYDKATDRVREVSDKPIIAPGVHPAGEPLVILLPAGTVADLCGQEFVDEIRLETPTVGRLVFLLRGTRRGQLLVDVRGYREERAAAYAPIAEQLDQIYHDFDGWREMIAAVKAEFPKDKK